ncbi:class I SAM-dependent methyltransferase [Kordia sp. SMS9]|uniref:class I SAM-dependent methyltransferase n=1 Tax=Kordia sp. SMS9 TaxID=2282170 RepID=UPI0013B44C30|nr:class I SAM-dependent methyltransferase [Kordia sp. SMS9]
MKGLYDFCEYVSSELTRTHPLKMCEIGSYMGESTLIFASQMIFDEIQCIDPFEGVEEFNEISNRDWVDVEQEFKLNTRYFDHIVLHRDYCENVADKFENNHFDLVYIDANHSYEDVKKNIELFLPKCKTIISGHDYQQEWPGVVRAVNEVFGAPDRLFADGTWMKKLP